MSLLPWDWCDRVPFMSIHRIMTHDVSMLDGRLRTLILRQRRTKALPEILSRRIQRLNELQGLTHTSTAWSAAQPLVMIAPSDSEHRSGATYV